MISASSYPGLKFSKQRPRVLDKEDRQAELDALDRKGTTEARTRAKGCCEIEVVGERLCARPGAHTHHMLGGNGRRGKGESTKAVRKQRVCTEHHSEINNGLIRRTGKPMPHWKDRYERVYA